MHIQSKLVLGLVVGGTLLCASQFGQPSKSANLTKVDVTLSNSRLSFFGKLAAGNSVGSTNVTIKTASAGPSYSTNQLQDGDSVRIGDSNSMGLYEVSATNPDSSFSVTSGLLNGNADTDDSVIATQSSTLYVEFQTVSIVPNGAFQVLVPARSAGAADGLPDGGYFDFGTSAPSITCPSDVNGYNFGVGPVSTATASAVTINSQAYHAYTCYYGGTPTTATQEFTESVPAVGSMRINGVINPAPNTSHTAGTADTHRIIVRHMNSTNSAVDTSSVSVGVIEAVQVSAEVPPQISFTIGSVAASQSVCNITTGVTSTATTVPFGELVIGTPKLAAQVLGVSTNAANGYVVTVAQSDQMGLAGADCSGDPPSSTSCIPDSLGDSPSQMSSTSVEDWNGVAAGNTTYGLAYTMATASGTPSTRFDYGTNTGNCAGTGDCYRQFADLDESQAPVEIFSYPSVTNTQTVNVCYKINVSAVQPAGTYSNYLTYRATASF